MSRTAMTLPSKHNTPLHTVTFVLQSGLTSRMFLAFWKKEEKKMFLKLKIYQWEFMRRKAGQTPFELRVWLKSLSFIMCLDEFAVFVVGQGTVDLAGLSSLFLESFYSPSLIAINQWWEKRPQIRAGADHQQYHR